MTDVNTAAPPRKDERVQIKFYGTKTARDTLAEYKRVFGVSHSRALEDLITDVLAGELRDAKAKEKSK